LPEPAEVSASWRLILGELESDLARMASGAALEDGGRIGSADWSPPTVLGPLPDEYAETVRGLIARQRLALEALEDHQRRTGEHLAAVRAAEPARGQQAAYLDVEG
jgi:alpha-galactosidase/6-phospho-beta-glucosidase family protein